MTEWQNYGIPEGQGKSSIAPTFSKQGYNEPHHDKTNKMKCAPSEDSDKLGHPLVWSEPCSVWSESSLALNR